MSFDREASKCFVAPNKVYVICSDLQSLVLEPNMRAALFNLALMYNNELKKPLLALPLLETLLSSHPKHVKAHLLLGDVQLNAVKNVAKARHHFQRAVDFQPKNAQAVHNLCVAQVRLRMWVNFVQSLFRRPSSWARRWEISMGIGMSAVMMNAIFLFCDS